MKALIVRSNMKFESHFYLFLFQSNSYFCMYHSNHNEYVGAGDILN